MLCLWYSALVNNATTDLIILLKIVHCKFLFFEWCCSRWSLSLRISISWSHSIDLIFGSPGCVINTTCHTWLSSILLLWPRKLYVGKNDPIEETQTFVDHYMSSKSIIRNKYNYVKTVVKQGFINNRPYQLSAHIFVN